MGSAPIQAGRRGKEVRERVKAHDLSPGCRAVWGPWRSQMGGEKSQFTLPETLLNKGYLLENCLYYNVNL